MKDGLNKIKIYFLSTYIIFLILPLSILLFFIPKLLELSKERAINTMDENLNKAGYVLDLTFDEIDRMVDQVQYFPDFEKITSLEKPKYGESESPWQLILFQKMFRPLTVQNALIYHYFLVTFPNGFVLNNSQIITDLDFFYTNIFHYKDWTRGEWENEIQLETGSKFIPEMDIYLSRDGENAKENSRMISYVHSVIVNRSSDIKHSFSAIFLLDEDYLQELLQFSQYNGLGSVALYDKKGRLLAADNGWQAFSDKDFTLMVNNISGEILLNGEKYLYGSLTSVSHDYVLLSCIPLKDLFHEINTFIRILFLMLIIVLITGTTTAWVLSGRQYRGLSRSLQLVDMNNLRSYKISEIFEVLNDRLAQRNLEYLLQKDRINTYHLRMLLNGEWSDSPHREKILENLNLTIDTPCQVALVNQSQKALSLSSHCLTPCQLTDDYTALIYTGINTNIIIEEDLKKLENQYEKEGNLLTASIGPSVSNLSDLPFSYQQARKGYSHTSPINRIIRTEEEHYETSKLIFSMEYENRLINATLAGNVQLLSELISSLFRDNNDILSQSLEALQNFQGQLMGTFSRVIDMSGIDIPEFNTSNQALSPDDLESKICTLFLSVAKRREAAKRSHNEELLNEIDQYIDHHFSNIMTNGNAIAAHCRISVTYLSSFLKEQRGVSYGKLLENRRMKEAEKLLSEENTSIGNIALRCGYENAGSFRRRFKVVFGLSPGEFRDKKTTDS